jgi:hypothetical protein
VEVFAVDDGDVNLCATQCLRGIQAAKAGADDNYLRDLIVSHVAVPYSTYIRFTRWQTVPEVLWLRRRRKAQLLHGFAG